MPWSIAARIFAPVVAIALVLAGVWYVRDLQARHGAAKQKIEALESQAKETAKAVFRSYEIGTRYEQDKAKIEKRAGTDVRYVDRLRIVPSEPVECATPGKPDEKAEPGLSRADVAALEATLRTIAGESFRLAAEANQCEAQLRGLQEFIERE
jgi:hypothetical protein